MIENEVVQKYDSRWRSVLKKLVPKRIRQARVRITAENQRRKFRHLSVEETFDRVYSEGWWGRGSAFDSGEGSANDFTDAYVELVRSFVNKHGIGSIVDLGCGDFRVGSRLVSPDLQYVGVDIVRGLIERNNAEFGSATVKFEQRDLTADKLPPGELGLLRQVLQHLSNRQIAEVLSNARCYRHLIVTEHIPLGDDVVRNVDKPHGPDIRMPERSGVFLESPPFSCMGQTLLEVPYAPQQILRSTLLETNSAIGV
jgi:hypothetical protein